jgi:hypothetical protein
VRGFYGPSTRAAKFPTLYVMCAAPRVVDGFVDPVSVQFDGREVTNRASQIHRTACSRSSIAHCDPQPRAHPHDRDPVRKPRAQTSRARASLSGCGHERFQVHR